VAYCLRANHSCLNNAQHSFIGDFLILRAARDLSARDLSAGTELTIQYTHPTEVYDETQDRLKQWGFECKCASCVDLKSIPSELLQVRDALLEEFEVAMSQTNAERMQTSRELNKS
jgi:hypothetical protein